MERSHCSRCCSKYEQQVESLGSKHAGSSPECNPPAKSIVILTGSTGTVGPFVLAQLLDDPGVAHVYCVNRSTNSECPQRTRKIKRGIHNPLSPDRVTFLTVDLTQSSYGLNAPTFQTLLDETTHVIHSAWPVDFNQPLSFFHCVNPETAAWHDLVPAFSGKLSTPGKILETVSFEEWVARLQASAAELDRDEGEIDEFLVQSPAVRLPDFYQQPFMDGKDGGKHGRLTIDGTLRMS